MAKPRNKRSKNKRPSPLDQMKVPRSMVFRRTKLGSSLEQLEKDLRKVMLPFTALRLKESARNTIKDFLHVAGPLGVSHFLILSQTKMNPLLRIARTPNGPTLTFQIRSYSLCADVIRMQARPRTPPTIFEHPPLVVMNNLGGKEDHLKLITIMFQNMFPALNVNTVKLSECHRILLLNYNKEDETLDLRHYAIHAQPVGVSRNIRKLVQQRALPDLGNLTDVSEFVLRSGYGSESEAEDESARVRLNQDYGRGNMALRQSAVKLSEIGPRLTLQLVRVEEGLSSGAIIYHRFVKKTASEIKELKARIESKEALKRKRRAEQEANVLKKLKKKKMMDEASLAGMKKGRGKGEETQEKEKGESRREEEDLEPDDDKEWFRQEVGQEPDEGFMNAGVPRGKMGKPGGPKNRNRNTKEHKTKKLGLNKSSKGTFKSKRDDRKQKK